MPTYEIEIPGSGKFRIDSDAELSDAQVFRAASGQADMRRMADPTAGMGGLEKFNAGMGKAFADIGRGAAQMVGAGPTSQETQETRMRDAPLMQSGAGMAGNIAGNIAAFAPASVVPGANTIAGAGALGASMGALQPSTGVGERVGNMAIGGAMGAGVQGVAQHPEKVAEAIKAPFKGAKALVEPLYDRGRKQILSRALRNVAPDNAAGIQQKLGRAQELVPGSQPTAAEVGESGGLAALQRSMAAVDPEAYATRATQQNEARVRELMDLAGSQGQRGAIEANRDAVANSLYKKAREQGLDQGMAKAMKPQIKNLMERMPSGVLEKARELARLNGEKFDSAGSMNGLHWIKQATDDMLSSSKQTGIGKQTERAITQFKGDLLSVMDELSPAYGQARSTFQTMSRPVNQMQVAQEISDRSINKLTGQLQPQNYARALSDDTAAQATGFNKATLENTLEPSQLARLDAIKRDLARSVMARDLGRGPGSDTTQKLAMSNVAQQSGLPMSVTNMPGMGRMGNWIYEGADAQMKKELSEVLLNPKQAAQLMAITSKQTPLGAPSAKVRNLAALLGRTTVPPAAMSLENE